METILEFKDITYYYESGNSRIDILDQAACRFEPGKLYTIVGPSGSGKTTTLTLAGALESPRSGNVYYKGQDIKQIGYTKYRNRNIAIVFQAYNLLPYLTPLQNVMAAMEITKNPIPDKKGRAQSLLGRMGLTPDQMRRGINKLSGGEQQRVAIARALATDADILLADEPTGNLDADTAKGIVAIFKELAHEDGKCVIAVTHSLEFSAQADVVVRLENHKLIAG
ncbi:ABC transporter ATP-binding protein [bacterium D16-76]|nr:ABC transporter ATP-binding protein [bacterium D16-76]